MYRIIHKVFLITALLISKSAFSYGIENDQQSLDYKNTRNIIRVPETAHISIDYYVQSKLIQDMKQKSLTPTVYIETVIFECQKIFTWHNIKLHTKKIEYWENEDQLSLLNKNFNQIYDDFMQWIYEKTVKADTSVLFIGDTEETIENERNELYGRGSMVGIRKYSVNLLHIGRNGDWDEKWFAYHLARGIGNNLGLYSVIDGLRNCYCATAYHLCVMYIKPYKWESDLPRMFHSCSIESFINNNYVNFLVDVTNKNPVTSPKCGNGIVETGEDCDCGIEQVCEITPGNKCCTGNCKFQKAEYQCDQGECCSDCQFKTPQICRYAQNECDIEEYCDGKSNQCPEDNRLSDGTKCGDNSYCMHGFCPTEKNTCQRIHPGVSNAILSRKCDKHMNRQKQIGGCEKYFNKREVNDLLCGKKYVSGECGAIFCSGSIKNFRHQKFTFRDENYVYTDCFVMDVHHETEKLYKPDGFNCGKEKMCFKQRCINASWIPSKCSSCLPNTSCTENGKCVPNSLEYFNRHIPSGLKSSSIKTKHRREKRDTNNDQKLAKCKETIKDGKTVKECVVISFSD